MHYLKRGASYSLSLRALFSTDFYININASHIRCVQENSTTMTPNLASNKLGETPPESKHRHDMSYLRRFLRPPSLTIAMSQHASALWQHQLKIPYPPLGLENPDNECYQNSVLSSLLHSPKFVELIERHICHENSECIGCRLTDLCCAYWAAGEDRSRLQGTVNAALSALRQVLPSSELSP